MTALENKVDAVPIDIGLVPQPISTVVAQRAPPSTPGCGPETSPKASSPTPSVPDATPFPSAQNAGANAADPISNCAKDAATLILKVNHVYQISHFFGPMPKEAGKLNENAGFFLPIESILAKQTGPFDSRLIGAVPIPLQILSTFQSLYDNYVSNVAWFTFGLAAYAPFLYVELSRKVHCLLIDAVAFKDKYESMRKAKSPLPDNLRLPLTGTLS